MRKNWSAPRLLSRRDFLRLSAAAAGTAAAGGMLSGCSEGSGENVRLMVWSPSQDQAKDSGEWLQTCCDRFAELHPEWNITFVYGVADEAGAAGTVSQDAEASADVFMFANDTLTTLTDAGALAKFGGIYADEISASNSPSLVDSLTMDDYIYGVPFNTNTWFMYYDKSTFSEDDIKNLDTMLTKGVVSFPFTNSWYLPAFYFGNGCTLFGDGTQEELGVDFAGQKAVDVTNYLIEGRKSRCTPTPAAKPSASTPTASTWCRPSSWPSTWAALRHSSCTTTCAPSSPATPSFWPTPPSPATSWWPPRTTPSTAPRSSSLSSRA